MCCSGLCRKEHIHRHAELAIPPLFWPVNCIKIGGHVALSGGRVLSGPTVYSLYYVRDLNNWVIQELLFADLAKTQYTRDDQGPYFCINLDQHR